MYLKNNVDVLLWNYRGYGLSSGRPSFYNIQKDAEYVVNFAKKENKWNKIAVHGISMGGLAASYLASYFFIN
jgi:alpha-beta hydrolase superfamily lysophospholipase